jgi:hypothetical protein
MCINLLTQSSSFSERSSPSLIRPSLQSESSSYRWNMNCPDCCDGLPRPLPYPPPSDKCSLSYKVRHLAESMEYRVAEKWKALNLINILPALYESRRFITVFTKAHTYPSCEPAQSSPRHPVSYFIIIFTLSLGLRGGLFRRSLPVKILCASCSLPCTPHTLIYLIYFVSPTIFGETYKS